jgi:hypothetical protein
MTPPARIPKITNTGNLLFDFPIKKSPNRMAKGLMLDYHVQIERKGPKEPGPGSYTPKTGLFDRMKTKGCPKFIKPTLIDEQFYDIINGTQRVFSPNFLDKN